MTRTAEQIITDLLAADLSAVQAELRNLRAVAAWALRQACDFGEGDQVVIAEPVNADNGWSPYRECLAVGATAVAKSIRFSERHDTWVADIVLDREWEVGVEWSGVEVVRHWHGPAADTPDGMEPPRDYDRKHYPDGRKHTFAMRVGRLRRADAVGEVTRCG